jgi:hypothetical protein
MDRPFYAMPGRHLRVKQSIICLVSAYMKLRAYLSRTVASAIEKGSGRTLVI